ncbi:hypothetical protein J5N97_000216 [Dioscorea zingiberensis]|uniref:protein-serine/threonine phosphatase n=1 Tax=Dioscorea zingiberensis TaxID=325984 RepID=A0A9D5BSL7_9LILI|nr:hypothetical protein J5N97_000216 [Dioscorea zingiberensis]
MGSTEDWWQTFAEEEEEFGLLVRLLRDYLTGNLNVTRRNQHTVGELKRRSCEATTVLPKRQKLLFAVEDKNFVDQVDSPEIVDDFELDQDEVVDIKDKDANKMTLKRRASQYKIKLLNLCREGKKLLVLDIDYTLYDHKCSAENRLERMRPYLHEFLSAVYAKYDIMIWSATRMKCVELKMGRLGVLSNPNYKITALLDHLAMISVQSDSHRTFYCKPLGLIWAQLPEFYNEKNTIMFDDLGRNFVMNPQNGLIIRPFRKAHLNRTSDQELLKLTQYLLAIAELHDLSSLDHRVWELYAEANTKKRRCS